MRIELEVNQKEFTDKIAEAYAELLYKSRHCGAMFGFKSDVGEAINKHALKIIESDPKYKNQIKKLLEDDEFLKQAISEKLQDEADDILKEMRE